MDLADRMKAYEEASRPTFPQRIPIILRVDGKSFHTLTRDCSRPFDLDLMESMDAVALALVLAAGASLRRSWPRAGLPPGCRQTRTSRS